MEDLEGILELDKSEGIYIDIGTRVYLEIEGVTYSVTSIFIGLLKDEFMMVTFPKRYKSVKNKLYVGNRMVVKYLFEGSVYAFQTSVIEVITNPIRAIAIEYPKVVQKRELRVVKRNNVIIPSRVEAKKIEFPAVVFDISKRGCRFKYNENKSNFSPLREGDILRLYCQFPGISDEIGCMATVRNVAREKGQLSIGAQFEDMADSFLTPLMHFLYSIEDFA
ncbi:MAG: flagellar brake protein [Proteobacteria bacterium]|nr:flagellar brake protein [Pseudomonadota bacterium]MBU1387693.1 flagellar brake protein [Pseudomonadota bacterium]MBU1543725.1 flagellar brake protein [Pseudomonadota bacterium]MBU2482212.1 flagellar brake protein [Pseudomonadota bacterium]